MNIAIDYDGTYTADPAFWDKVMWLAIGTGHGVYCVTMRYYPKESIALPLDGSVMVVYTGRMAKKPHMDKLGINIDIWIDDNPAWIYTDSIPKES